MEPLLENKVERGTPVEAIVKSTKQSMDFHSPEVLVLQHEHEGAVVDAWIPMIGDLEFAVGQQVTMTRVTTYHPNGLGGSHSIFEISPK